MQIRQILKEDNAVSPVIGVILMVAITVILAAVIATFVLGLGDDLNSSAPQASFATDYDGGSDSLTITHDGGDAIKANELYIRGEPADSTTTLGNWTSSGSSTVSGSNSKVVAGDRVEFTVGSSYDLRVVYQSEDGGNSATLTKDKGPDA